ncbi:hypothetical protein BGW39_002252, partial [Mortierella sp. 14UC]
MPPVPVFAPSSEEAQIASKTAFQVVNRGLPGPKTPESTENGPPVPVDTTEGGGSAATEPATEPAPANPAESGSSAAPEPAP